MTPTQRTMKMLKSENWTCQIVEHWNPFARIRQDLFGFADILATRSGNKPRLIQVTASGASSRVKKIIANQHAPLCLE